MSLLNFNAGDVAPASPFEPVPDGDYVAHIVESEVRETRAGDGEYLALTLEIIEGKHQGRKLFDRLNLDNPNKQTVEIARRTLSSICHAVGVLNLEDSEELHCRPLRVSVRVRPAGPDRSGVEREAQSEIRAYSALNTGLPQGSVSPQRPATGLPSWAR